MATRLSSRYLPARLVCLGILALIASACASSGSTQIAADQPLQAAELPAESAPTPQEPTSPVATAQPPEVSASIEAATAVPTTAPVPTPSAEPRPSAPNGSIAPWVAQDALALAEQVATAERGLLDPSSSPEALAQWGHLHQVAIRKLGYETTWDADFFTALPPEFRERTGLHLDARRALIDLSSGYDAADFIPAWEIVEPEPAEALLSYYQEAETNTGIEWEYLAAINLIETGMGRIRGLSSAGAKGPMQFLPTTWAESGIGEGDIEDPNDAINAAARYLVRRGGPADMDGALWGYNNHDLYVTAVQAYAEAIRQDPAAYAAIYNWEIYFHTEAGDIWLPPGFRTDESMDLYDYLDANPWSAPDPNLN